MVTQGDSQSQAVVAYEAFYQRSFAEQTYNSCSRVRIPAAATLAVGSMCGVYGSALCNAQRWLNFQGDTSNGLAPLDITFHLWEPSQAEGSTIQPLNDEVVPCNQSQGDGAAACSCQDCAASCPVIAQPRALDPTFRLGRMEGSLVLIIILCSLFVLLTAFLLRSRLAEWCRGKRKTPKPKASINLAHRLSLSTHTLSVHNEDSGNSEPPGLRGYISGFCSSKGFSATWLLPRGPPASWLILPYWLGLPLWRSLLLCRPSCVKRRAGLCPGPSPPLLCGLWLSHLSSRGKAAMEDWSGNGYRVFVADARLT